jgi:peroxiredoxin
MGRIALGLALAGLLLAPGLALADDADDELPQVGSEAPGFALPVYNPEASGAQRAGTMLLVGEDSEDTNAKVIVVSFMASFCKPCKKELPFLQQLHSQYKEMGLRLIGVSIDKEAEGQKEISELLKKEKVSFPVVKDQYNFTARRYLGNQVPLPSVFVLDKSGKIVFVSRGYSEEISKKLVAAIQKELGGKQGASK